jgi:hypothetical protein
MKTFVPFAAAALAALAAGCGGSPPRDAAAQAAPVRFSACMRSQGIARFPDPGGSGAVPKVALDRLGVSDSRFQAATRACRDLLPNGGRPANQTERRRIAALGLRFARCVRAHGVENFPDPGSDGRIPDPATAGIDQSSPKFQSANQACGASRPPYMPSNSAYNTWARTAGR